MMTTMRAAATRRLEGGPEGSGGGAVLLRTVVVVEDEQDIRELLRFHLEREGYRVLALGSGEQAVRSIQIQQPDLVVLDLMLPGMDGLEVCRALKREAKTAGIAIVMLTAKGEEADVVAGLELGADDYVTKPFSPRVLLARVRAVMRRRGEGKEGGEGHSGGTGGAVEGGGVIRAGGLVIHRDRHEVVAGDRVFELTVSEFRLLCLLASGPGRVYPRQQIVQKIHGDLAAVTDRSVDVLVMGLRRKIQPYDGLIQTVRGVGYRFKD